MPKYQVTFTYYVGEKQLSKGLTIESNSNYGIYVQVQNYVKSKNGRDAQIVSTTELK